ncbi:hypothetical protein GALL_139890 [mine drainage metagenome]|uniref:Uncharacterized protein n=1 Tax=mine drainage metagenome TaxID=410659 RepID=A0A1J5S5S9_9ZZZZ
MTSIKIPLLFCLAIAAAPSGRAASPKAPRQRPPAFVADLSPRLVKHGALCPLPSQGRCVIKKPVGMRYRVLSSDVDLEDIGDYWVADFSKSKGPETGRELLRILAENGDLHEIDVHFPRPPVKAKPAVKPPAAKKEPVKEPAKEEEQTP